MASATIQTPSLTSSGSIAPPKQTIETTTSEQSLPKETESGVSALSCLENMDVQTETTKKIQQEIEEKQERVILQNFSLLLGNFLEGVTQRIKSQLPQDTQPSPAPKATAKRYFEFLGFITFRRLILPAMGDSTSLLTLSSVSESRLDSHL
jgi:hypothetical protein